jgi:hypothetical protein
MSSERRPRLDAMIRAISDGKYDEELDEIIAAINGRVDSRKKEVMRMVREVFGEDAVIKDDSGKYSPSEFMKKTARAENPLNIIKSGQWKPSENIHVDTADEEMISDAEIDPDEVISAEKPENEPLTGEFESRSPQFGAIEDKKEGESDGGEQ